jgi:perosamine synthetase
VPEKWIPIAEPRFDGNELKYLTECIETGWISSVGKFVGRFEKEFAAYIGCKLGMALHTGTHALHLAIAGLGIGEDDEVILPSLTFAATANTVLYTGARPVLTDVDEETWNITPDEFEKAITPRTKAVIPVHLYGHACDMDPIMEIARSRGLFVIEDAAEAHGAEYKGQRVGSIGDVGCFSFFGNKIITTGEGGMCVCDDADLIERMEILRDHGMRKEKKYWHEVVGFNYRMTNLQAAVGVAQLERIDWFLQRKRDVAALYRQYLAGSEKLILPVEKEYTRHAFWMFNVRLRDNCRLSREELLAALREEGIECRPVFYPLHIMTPYRQSGEFPVTDKISASGISLPSSSHLTEPDIGFICQTLTKLL